MQYAMGDDFSIRGGELGRAAHDFWSRLTIRSGSVWGMHQQRLPGRRLIHENAAFYKTWYFIKKTAVILPQRLDFSRKRM
jgi:hypothetical protein